MGLKREMLFILSFFVFEAEHVIVHMICICWGSGRHYLKFFMHSCLDNFFLNTIKMFWIGLILFAFADAEDYARSISAIFCETSAVTAINVEDLFMAVG